MKDPTGQVKITQAGVLVFLGMVGALLLLAVACVVAYRVHS